MNQALESVVETVASSRRYRDIAPQVLRRIAGTALRSADGDVDDAAKRAKRALHQIYGAFVPRSPRWERLLERLGAGLRRGVSPRPLLREFMSVHASTRERLAVLDRFYPELLARCGAPERILDLGCGLNPLAWPWLEESGVGSLRGFELDERLVGFLGGCLDALGAQHAICARDLLGGEELGEADLALALKLVPTLEQQERGSAAPLLQRIRAPVLLVSFPKRSLGRRLRGLEASYAKSFEEWVTERRWRSERVEFPLELVYIVWK